MNRKFRILSIVFLTAVYCFAVSFVNKSYNFSESFYNQTTEQEKLLTGISAEFFGYSAQNDNVFNQINHPIVSHNDSFSRSVWAVYKHKELLFESEIAHYINSSRNIPVELWKTLLIFPFHTFL